MPRTRITAKMFEAFVAELIEDGQLVGSPVSHTGGDIGHGTRFAMVDSHVCLGPREALEYVRDNVDNLNAYIRRTNRK